MFTDDESEESEEEDLQPEEGPEVVDPPAIGGHKGRGEDVVRHGLNLSTDEDEYVDIEGSDSEYDEEVDD